MSHLHAAPLQKERRLTGLHKDIEALLFDPDFKGTVGERWRGVEGGRV